MNNSRLYTVYLIGGILLAIIGVLYFLNITNINSLIPKVSDKEPFTISIEPSFIEEGQYNYNGINQWIPITFTLTIPKNRNITYFELKEDSVIIDRKNKTTQTSVSQIHWKNKYDNSHIFYRSSNSLGYSNTQSAVAELSGCQNCFMGEDKPYIITLTFTYSEENGEKKAYPINVELPIV